jgi:transposase
MRRIDLAKDEENKYEVIKELVEKNGNKNRAAKKLCCTRRSIDRYIKGYKTYGKEFFVHGNRGRKPAHALTDEVKESIVDLYRTKYYDATYQHFTELLQEFEGIKVSEAVVRGILMAQYLLSPRATKEKKKEVRKLLEEMKKATVSSREKDKLQALIIDIEDAHARRPRCEYFGEMQQMDACKYPWFGGIQTTLHIAVDDATGTITGAWFDKAETLNGYYNVFWQILMNYGIPLMFYTDRRTIFEYKKKGDGLDENDTYTQFAYACSTLGVEIMTTSVSQAKGRVERMFWTLQSRLPVMLRLVGVTTIEQANEYLKQYLPRFNKRFALDYSRMQSVFENKPTQEKANLTLAVLSRRIVDNGHSIRFSNKYYRTVNQAGLPVYFHKGTEGLVIRTFDNNLYFSVEDRVYALEEIPEHERKSRNFDFGESKVTPIAKYIPPMNHPWRKSIFAQFRQKQSHCADLKTGT